MLNVRYESKFKKDFKAVVKRGYDISLLEETIDLLRNQTPLPEKYKDHFLQGNYAQHRECHILSDWLLVYQVNHNELILTLTRTGTHSDLF